MPDAMAGTLPRARAPSLRRRMLVLIGGLVSAFLGLAALGVHQVQAAAERQLSEQLLGTARALARAVDGEFGRAEALLLGLAQLPSLRSGDFATFIANAREAAEALGMPVVGVAGPEGMQRINSLAPPERLAAGLPAAPEVVRVFRTGRTEVSDWVEGNDPGLRRIVLAVPVRFRGEGEAVPWALGVVVPRERLSEALAAQRIPEDRVVAILDRAGTVVARSRAEAAFLGRPATPDVRAALAAAPEGVIGRSATLEGEASIAAFARGPASGYAVVIGAPEAAFAAERRRLLLGMAAVGLPLAGFAAVLALLLARQVAATLRALAAPGAGTVPRLREAEDLAGALAAERALRDAVEERLRERGAWLEAAQQAARVGVWEADLAEAGPMRWSEGMWRILGRAPGDRAPALDAVVHPEDLARVAAAMDAARRPGGGAPFAEEFRVAHADGGWRWVQGQGVVHPAGPGTGPARMLGAWIDVTERRALEEAREAATRQRDLLAAEIHHRIRNSLQLVLSLLLLQARRAAPEAAAPLRDAATRVATIANVHRRLYEAGPELAGDVGAYLQALARDLHASVGDEARGRALDLALEPGVTLPPDRLPAIGIVATELVTNAFKYGAHAVTLTLRRTAGGGVEIGVQDGGSGFPDGFDPSQSRGLGMRVAMTLARQIGGTLRIDRGAPGGRVVLGLPAEAMTEAA